MTEPFARPMSPQAPRPADHRPPKAFVPAKVEILETEPYFETMVEADVEPAPLARSMGWTGRIAWGTGGLLVSLGLGLMADRLIRDLFARFEWLGWAGTALLAAFGVALLAVIAREMW